MDPCTSCTMMWWVVFSKVYRAKTDIISIAGGSVKTLVEEYLLIIVLLQHAHNQLLDVLELIGRILKETFLR